MTTALYVRTSTDDNDGAAQLSELRRVSGGGVEYVDRGESGTKAFRPAWDNLLRDCRAGKIRAVYATELSRLGRSVVPVVLALDELQRLGVRVVLTRQGLDYGTPVGQLVAQILVAVAQLERAQILERTRAGIERAKAKGVRFGRPERSVDAQRARELLLGGASWRTVSRAMGVPLGTLRRAVERTKTPTKNGRA